MTERADTGTRALGAYGERLAARYLQERGMVVLDRNWRCEHGEIDLVVLDGDCLVVCEVKTRRSVAFGEPVEAVTRRKAARLRRLASAWLAAHDARPNGVRIDVVGIMRPPTGPVVLRHLRGVA
ncbi:MAG TPA: YraN family protein [Pedococcus sp.]